MLALGTAASAHGLQPSVEATLRVPARVYAGYLNVFTVKSKASLSGARVLLQQRKGKRWKTVVQAPYRQDSTELVAALPAGRQSLRVRIETGAASFDVAKRKMTVRRGRPALDVGG